MKTYYVYEIINILGSVEYVGQTSYPKVRWNQHTKTKPINAGSSVGKFYGRGDVFMNIVNKFDTKVEARDFEESLQKDYGFKTDRSKIKFGLNKANQPKSIKAYDSKTNKFIGTFKSIAEASRVLNIAKQTIYHQFKHNKKDSKGYLFKYA
jgi:hypothetical protein